MIHERRKFDLRIKIVVSSFIGVGSTCTGLLTKEETGCKDDLKLLKYDSWKVNYVLS